METTAPSPATKDRADVLLFPPAVGLALFLLGIILHLLSPLHLLTSGTSVLTVIGIFVLLSGIALQVVCMRIFKRAHTTPLFKKASTQIVQHGPYARSRNPIYLAVFVQFLGLALLVNTWWLMLAIPILFLYLNFGVIAREEIYLEQKFADEYRAYKAKVRRWI